MSTSRVGLLNLMPETVYERTAQQWERYLGPGANVEVLRFANDPRGEYAQRAYPVELALDEGLDALVVTGANLERDSSGNLLPYEEVRYAKQLAAVVLEAEKSTRLTVYSCFAAQFALSTLFDGMPRTLGEEKIHGVFCHDVLEPTSDYVSSIEMPFRAPHSRWASVPTGLLERAGVSVIAESFEAGWLLAANDRPQGTSVFLQGHPEYGQFDLAEEYNRDCSASAKIPYGYFPNNDAQKDPVFSWRVNAETLFGNVVAQIQAIKVDYR